VVRKNPRMGEVVKGKMIEGLDQGSADAYEGSSSVIGDGIAGGCQARWRRLHQTVRRPTRAMLEQNKKEVASRHESEHGVEPAGQLGEASRRGQGRRAWASDMVDPEPMTATGSGKKDKQFVSSGDNKVTVETTNGTVTPNRKRRVRMLHSGGRPGVG